MEPAGTGTTATRGSVILRFPFMPSFALVSRGKQMASFSCFSSSSQLTNLRFFSLRRMAQRAHQEQEPGRKFEHHVHDSWRTYS